MNIKGSRKIIMSAMFGAAIVAVPGMTDSQVTLFSTLILAAFGGNGIEYLAEVAKGAVRARSGVGAVSSVRPVTVQDAPESADGGAH